ncbi:Integrin alpha-L [Labeo rohita]|uniref:Integrin alpha-L n=1 Tax=Labeo rohita TaxID=84645 RepID=A0ABQ8L336_LABRO|nr:Integrin alpha-L [Labeo rohita]
MLIFWSLERGYNETINLPCFSHHILRWNSTVSLASPASLSEAFNIDTEHPLRFNGTPEDFFAALQICSPANSCSGQSCGPYFSPECDGNSYLIGACYQFNSSLQAISNFTVAYQECTKREVNVVFLFDGSSSMRTHEFQMNKDFIKNFAAVQFSSDLRTVKNLLNNVSSGASPNAQKALVIITDGDPSDNDRENVLSRCDEQNIDRYIIGYSGLEGLIDNLQKKINNIKGSKEAHGRNVQRELSQSGFSVIHQESCSPYFSPECGGKSYLISVCYQFNSSLQAVSDFTVAYQGLNAPKREVNVVFLFDGSSSMKAHEFQMNKDFIKNVMEELSDSSIKFAAVQFSSERQTVFDFNDYQNGFAENLLNNVSSGANPNAQKALVIITDGEPSDNDRENVLSRCDEQNIVRYIIGVGKVSLNTLTKLASEPKQNNTFYIQQYSGLQGLADNLQKKINNIKGSKEARGRNVQRELSQSGFSVIHQEDSVIVGSVGSNDWRGALYEVTGSGSKETQIIDPAVGRDSYMGYSSLLGMRHGVALLFSGAPRAERTGLVTLFTKKQSTWTVTRHIRGEQVGSYFGASLSLLDVDSDGDSDFLLVGAPLFYQSQQRADGRLYVYALSEQHFQKTQTVSKSTTGRFAASVASLKDLNGDSLPDVAVGAPLENEGVVYIYLGDATRGINPEHAPQRIPARSVLPGLQQFGVSLSGQLDMNDDNLTDIVIGARGGIVLLRARPVMSVSAQLSFSPKEISLNYFECPGGNTFNAFNLTSCFLVSERTSSTGSLEKKLNVFLNLNVDVVQGINRGFFDPMDSSSRTLQQSVLLDSGFSCFSFSIFMPRCIADTVSPMKIQMNFSQTKMLSGNTMAVLDIHSRTEEYVEDLKFKQQLCLIRS